ncbi:MAG: outer membrane lipoprotein-sorting protein [Bryobacteraceae bacterium]
MKPFHTAVLVAIISSSSVFSEPKASPIPEDQMVSRYLEATQAQQSALRGGTEEVDIDAAVPKFQKHGKLHALRSISKLGKITYKALGFSGDNVVKTEVIANYLKAEVESAAKASSDIALTPENYKFKYKGTEDWNGRQVYVLHVNPREKKVGLFKGELWLDAETYMPVREAGSFVKSPSFMLKKMQFVRDYELQNGVSLPQRTESQVETRFFGKVELSINYLTFSKDTEQGVAEDAEAVADAGSGDQ